MSKVWFVTGAGSGIGAATVRAALKAGDRVVATGRNLQKVRNSLRDVAGDNVTFVQLDVTKEAQAKAAVGEAIKVYGRIDVLVNNAGYSLLGNFEELSTGEIEQLIATNFYGVMHMMRAVLPVMRQQRSGRIINVSSLAGIAGFKHCGAYSAAKFAVEGLSASVALRSSRLASGSWRSNPASSAPTSSMSTMPNMPAARSKTTPRKAQPKPCGPTITAHTKVIPPGSVTSW